MTTVTHVAGPAVIVAGRGIQRCCVCGEKLIDTKNQMVPLSPDGTPGLACCWADGAMVQFEEGNPRRESHVGQFGVNRLPSDSCIALVEG